MVVSYKILKDLLAHLSKKEIIHLKKKILTNVEKEDLENNKSLRLVNAILFDPEISSLSAEQKVYGAKNNVAFIKLVDRIIDKIDEIFINFNRDASFFNSERNYYYFFLKRKLLVLQMRWLRGIEYGLGFQFEKIIALSKKYEIYEVLIEALHVKQRFLSFRLGTKAFDKIESEITKFEEYRFRVQNSRRLFTKLAAEINSSSYTKHYREELDRTVGELENNFAITKSPTIEYYLLYLRVEQLDQQNKFSDAEKLLNSLYGLIKKNYSVFTKARECEILLNLSNSQLHQSKFNEALSTILKASNFFERNSVSFNVVKEQEYFCRFYLGELELAENIINSILRSSHSGNIPFLYSKRAYLFACLKTIKGEIAESNELLQQARALEKNKGGWNIAKRILTIINCVEAQDHEKAELQVANLEKFIKRNSKSNHVRKRDILILRILLKLINENYDFKKVYKSRRRYFDLLEGNDPDYSWKIKSPELIVFHKWFSQKMAYQRKLAMAS